MQQNSWNIVIAILVPMSHAFRAEFPFDISLARNCNCALLVEPVCGYTGSTIYTYMNECALKCAQKLNKSEVNMLYKGACCREQRCSPFDTPVCDAQGEMHKSSCAFELAQCVELRQHGRHLAMDSTAPKCSCLKKCNAAWAPVCDTTGVTHANPCVFQNSQCFHSQQLNMTTDVDYKGTCCDDMCRPVDAAVQAVCDSNNSTHSDLCSFYKAQCIKARKEGTKIGALKIKAIGPCRPNEIENDKTSKEANEKNNTSHEAKFFYHTDNRLNTLHNNNLRMFFQRLRPAIEINKV